MPTLAGNFPPEWAYNELKSKDKLPSRPAYLIETAIRRAALGDLLLFEQRRARVVRTACTDARSDEPFANRVRTELAGVSLTGHDDMRDLSGR